MEYENTPSRKLFLEPLNGTLGPAHSRLWVFPLEKVVDPEKRELLLSKLREFAGGWNAHKKAVAGFANIAVERFVLMSADESLTGVSGCSTDSMFRAVQLAVESLGMKLADQSLLFYVDEKAEDGPMSVQTITRAEFKQLAKNGFISPETFVFDPIITTAGDVYSGNFLKRVQDSWHSRLLAS